MTQLVRYDAMCRAIAEAHAVDEVKDIRDKALALEQYFRQAKNTENERKACEVRLRAERKAGQLLQEMEKAKGARGNSSNQYRQEVPSQRASTPTLADLGISHTQSSRWQKLASIPDADFEATFAKAQKPSTNGMISAHAPRPAPELKKNVVDDGALWFWGMLLEFERQGLLKRDPNEVCANMLAHMKETVREIAPVIAEWLSEVDV